MLVRCPPWQTLFAAETVLLGVALDLRPTTAHNMCHPSCLYADDVGAQNQRVNYDLDADRGGGSSSAAGLRCDLFQLFMSDRTISSVFARIIQHS